MSQTFLPERDESSTHLAKKICKGFWLFGWSLLFLIFGAACGPSATPIAPSDMDRAGIVLSPSQTYLYVFEENRLWRLDTATGEATDLTHLTDRLLLPSGVSITAFVVHPDGRLVLGTKDDGIWMSMDEGENWISVHSTIAAINSLAVHPTTGKLYAAIENHGLWQSADEEGWANLDATSFPSYTLCLTVNPQGTMYAGTNKGVVRSTDGGSNWNDTEGIQSPVTLIVSDERQQWVVYALADNGLYESTDDGASWHMRLAQDEKNPYYALALDPDSLGVLQGGRAGGISHVVSDTVQATRAISGTVLALSPTNPQSGDPLFALCTGDKVYRILDVKSAWESEIPLPRATESTPKIPFRPDDFGAIIYTVAAHPTKGGVVYAGTDAGGIFRSEDSGATWEQIALADKSVLSLIFHPQNPEVLYAVATDFSLGSPFAPLSLSDEPSFDLFKSEDGGQQWQPLNVPAKGRIGSVALDPKDPQKLYLNTSKQILVSRNGGQTWEELETPDPDVNYLALDPPNGVKLYAATEDGVFSNSDKGKQWSRVWPDLIGKPVYGITFKPGSSQTIYVATDEAIFRSTDGGIHWGRVLRTFLFPRSRSFLPDIPPLNPLLINHLEPRILYATTGTDFLSVYIKGSEDSGGSWEPLQSTAPVLALSMDAKDTSKIYAGGLGALRTIQNRSSWQAMEIPAYNIYDLALNPADPYTIYAIGLWGLFKSTDGGATWRHVTGGDSEEFSFSFFNAIPRVAVREDVVAISLGKDLWISADGGNTWKKQDPLPENIAELAFHPTRPEILYLGTDQGLFLSGDGGVQWTAVYTDVDKVFDLAVAPQAPQTLYMATISNTLKSTDGGQNWHAIWSGESTALAVHPTQVDTVYLGTRQGVLKSTHGGGRWNPADAGITDRGIVALAIDPKEPDILYAATAGGGIFKSTNGGDSWTNRILPSLPTERTCVSSVETYQDQPGYLYAAGAGGIFVSPDRGRRWRLIKSAVVGYLVRRHPKDPDIIYAVTEDGLLRSADGGVAWSKLYDEVNLFVSGLAVSQDDETLYLATDNGLFRGKGSAAAEGLQWTHVVTEEVSALALGDSCLYIAAGGAIRKTTDNGQSWQELPLDKKGRIRVLLTDPQNAALVYASNEGGVWRSDDGGEKWQNISAQQSLSLALDPQQDDVLYVGTPRDIGLIRLERRGARWETQSLGLENIDVVATAIEPANSQTLIYLGTGNNSFYISNDGGKTWSDPVSLRATPMLLYYLLDCLTPPRLWAVLATGLGLVSIAGLILSRRFWRPKLQRQAWARERDGLKQELDQHKRNLYKLHQQAAIYGAGEIPLRLLNQIEKEEQDIQHIEEQLARLPDRR